MELESSFWVFCECEIVRKFEISGDLGFILETEFLREVDDERDVERVSGLEIFAEV